MSISDLSAFSTTPRASDLSYQHPVVARCQVVKPQATAISQSIFVVVLGEPLAYPVEIVRNHWRTFGGSTPQVGDICAVAFDHQGDAWLIGLDHAPAAWLPLPYATGAGTGNWSDVGAGSEPGSYLLESRFCHIRATCKNATGVAYPSTNTLIATLPPGVRPLYSKTFTGCGLDTGSHYIDFVMQALPDGRVMLLGADVGEVPLGNNGSYQWLSFSTDWAVS